MRHERQWSPEIAWLKSDAYTECLLLSIALRVLVEQLVLLVVSARKSGAVTLLAAWRRRGWSSLKRFCETTCNERNDGTYTVAGSRHRTKEAPLEEARAEAHNGFRQAAHRESEGLRRTREGHREEDHNRLLGGDVDGAGGVGGADALRVAGGRVGEGN